MADKVKKTVKKAVAKPKVLKIKPRAGATMTEPAFWSFIRSALRQKSRWWAPITQVKLAARRDYTGPNKRQKFEYLCKECKAYFPEKEINVDHMIPAGALNSGADLEGFVNRLFCEGEHLQVLCETCHNVKTQLERKENAAAKANSI
jgi:5-methylcytosine-specific restriction endonuclease McrA